VFLVVVFFLSSLVGQMVKELVLHHLAVAIVAVGLQEATRKGCHKGINLLLLLRLSC